MIFYALCLRGSTSAGSAEGASTSLQSVRPWKMTEPTPWRVTWVGEAPVAEELQKCHENLGIWVYTYIIVIYIYIIGYEYDLIK